MDNQFDFAWVTIGCKTFPVSMFKPESGFMYMEYSRIPVQNKDYQLMVSLHYKDGNVIKCKVKSPVALREMLRDFCLSLEIQTFCGIDLHDYTYFEDVECDYQQEVDDADDICNYIWSLMCGKHPKKPISDTTDCVDTISDYAPDVEYTNHSKPNVIDY